MDDSMTTRLQAATTYYQQIGEKPLDQLEAQAPVEWQIGDVILDLYEITALLGEGGMGKVFRAHHRGWNMDLAVKCPKASVFTSVQGKEDYIREAETWINLGLHPYIASCYYVRVLGGVPRLFAECVEGGSLESWIESGRLYEGGKEKVLKRILDIAIQFAWGLAYAHEQGLVHQDVKPHNVLMTPEGVAKVTDFGLAKARAVAGEGIVLHDSPLVSAGGYTPAYCSPEQAQGEKLDHKTDIWSWGVSVLEMFTGGVTWMSGVAAGSVLESFLETGPGEESIPAMPPLLVKLLRDCFSEDPTGRPGRILWAAERLHGIYKIETGQAYHRETPTPAELRADSLNNKALSLLDLGKGDASQNSWESALRIDPYHSEATYNLGMWRWQTKEQTDLELVRNMEAVIRTRGQEWEPYYLLGLVHIRRNDVPSAKIALEEAKKQAPDSEQVEAALQSLDKVSSVGLQLTLEGHTQSVAAIAITPDGRRIVSGSNDKTLRVWDIETGECLNILQGHSNAVVAVALTPDGNTAVSSSTDKTLRVWNLSNGKCLHILSGHTEETFLVKIAPDGQKAVSGSFDKSIRVWDLHTGKCLLTLQGHKQHVNFLSFTAEGNQVVSGSADHSLKVWDAANGTCLRTLENVSSWSPEITLTVDGQKVIANQDKSLCMWDLYSGEVLQNFEGHTRLISAVVVTPDGKKVITGSADRTLCVWNLADGRCLQTLRGHTDWVHFVAVTPDGRRVVSGSKDQTVRVWDLASGECLYTIEDFEGGWITPDGLKLVSGGKQMRVWRLPMRGAIPVEWAVNRPQTAQAVQTAVITVNRKLGEAKKALDSGLVANAAAELSEALSVPGFEHDPGILNLWHTAGRRAGRPTGLRTVHLQHTLQGHNGMINAVVFSPDGQRVVSASNDHTLIVWDLSNGVRLQTLSGHTDYVNAVAFTPDGKRLVSCSRDHSVRVWDLESGVCQRTLLGHTGPVFCAATTRDGRYVITGGIDHHLFVWDMDSGASMRILEGHTDYVECVAVSPDGRQIVSGSHDKTLRVWDYTSGKCQHVLRGHQENVTAIAFSADGRNVISGSRDNSLRVWNLTSGELLFTLPGHEGNVKSFVLTPDNQKVISGGTGNSVRVWDLTNGKQLKVLMGHQDWVYAVAITPDGRWVVSASKDHSLRIWDIDSGECTATLHGHTDPVNVVAISPNGGWIVSGGGDYQNIDTSVRVWSLVWDYQFPEFTEWDENARAYLEVFLTRHTPQAAEKPGQPKKPSWTKDDFQSLMIELGFRGYGWLKPEGVTRQLQRLLDEYTPVAIHHDHAQDLIGEAREYITKKKYKQAYLKLEEVRSLAGFERNAEILELSGLAGQKAGRQSGLRLAQKRHKLEGHTSKVHALAFTPDGRLAVSGSDDRTIRLWGLTSGQCTQTLQGHSESIHAVAIRHDGLLAVSGSADKRLLVWDLENQVSLHILEGHAHSVFAVAITPDQRKIVSGSGDETIKIWEIASGKCLRTLSGHTGSVYALAVSADGRQIISGSVDNTLRVWDFASGACLRTLQGHTSWIHSVAASPDGRLAISAGDDFTIRMWSLDSGACLRIYKDRRGLQAAFTQDVRWAFLGFSQYLEIDDLVSGDYIHGMEGDISDIYTVAVTPDGRWLASSGLEPAIWVWTLDWNYEFPEPADWHEGARVYLENFLSMFPPPRKSLFQKPKPRWAEEDFQGMLADLKRAGYGWLRPEGVRKKLQEMATERG